MYYAMSIAQGGVGVPCAGESFYCIQLQLQGGQFPGCIIISEKLKEFSQLRQGAVDGKRWQTIRMQKKEKNKTDEALLEPRKWNFPVSAWLPFSQPSWLGNKKDKNRRREQQNRLIVGRKGWRSNECMIHRICNLQKLFQEMKQYQSWELQIFLHIKRNW